MQFHPLADIFPLMADDEFERFVEDIRANGQLQPIYTFEGKIIDGRNRYIACERLRIEPVIEEWHGAGSLIGFVVSLNLSRRHLNESQRAMVAARLNNYSNNSLNVQICTSITQTNAAEALNVSLRSVASANQVLKNSEPEIVEAVEHGELSINQATKLAELPRAKQKNLVRKGVGKLRSFAASLTKKRAKAINRKNLCLLCNTETEFTVDNYVHHLLKLQARAPQDVFNYIQDQLEEIDEYAVVESINLAYERIIASIEAGHTTRADMKIFTRLSDVLLDGAIAFLIEHNTVGINSQGGKHPQARGARKTLYFLKKKYVRAQIDPDDFDEFMDDFGDDYAVPNEIDLGGEGVS